MWPRGQCNQPTITSVQEPIVNYELVVQAKKTLAQKAATTLDLRMGITHTILDRRMFQGLTLKHRRS